MTAETINFHNPKPEDLLVSNVNPAEINQNLNPEIKASMQNFGLALEVQGQVIPEVAEKRTEIETAGQELINDFGIKAGFFEGEGRSLVFTSIASRYAELKASSEGQEIDSTEKEFIADTTYLLAKDHIDGMDDLKAQLDIENNPNRLSEEGRQKAYDKYTDKGFTDRLKQAIDEGLLDEVKTRLGITPDNEDPYELRVLSINDNKSYVHGFKRIESTDWDVLKDLPLDERKKIMKDYDDQQALRKQWEQGLITRKEDFQETIGMNGDSPAWMTEINGTRNLCITSVMAERMLDRDEVGHEKLYQEDDYKHDLATLEHEYTHTQGGLTVDGSIDFGISLEERRAEYYSGDKAGYGDVKNFLTDVMVISGEHPLKYLAESELKGGTQEEVFTKIANHLGVGRLLEIVAVMPSVYNEDQSNKVRSSIQKYLGGYDGVLQRLMKDQQAKGNETLVKERVEKRTKELHDIMKNGTWGLDSYLAYRRGSQKLNFITDLMEAEAIDKGYITVEESEKSA